MVAQVIDSAVSSYRDIKTIPPIGHFLNWISKLAVGYGNLDISVLQGTIVGPILFLCFINDLPNATDLDSRLFADDTACTHSNSHLPTLIDIANTEIQKLANWFRSNKMAVNISKTKYIIFHGKVQ